MKLAGKILVAGAVILSGGNAAHACDLELSQVQDYLASVDVTGMNLEQQLATRERALAEFHEAAVLKADAGSLRRSTGPAATSHTHAANGSVSARD